MIMKRTLVLSGGGTKGIYECGAIRALMDLNKFHFDRIIGVSVGALNAAMLVQGNFEKMEELYDTLEPSMIVNGFIPVDQTLFSILKEREEFHDQLNYYLKEGGIDVRPFYKMVDKYYEPDKFFASTIDFGCVVAKKKDHSGVYVDKKMMKEHGKEWLIASAAAYPAFPVCTIDGIDYVDGGYYDNFPIDYALQKGTEEIIGIEMGKTPLHDLYMHKRKIHIIHPHTEIFSFLNFDHEKMHRAKIMGYNDTMKEFGIYDGERYTFNKFSVYQEFERELHVMFLLENRIKNCNLLNEIHGSEHVISDQLMEQLGKPFLTDKDYIFGMLDALLELCDSDETKVYTIQEAKYRILAFFASAADKDYSYVPKLRPSDMIAFAKTLDRKGRVSRMIHGMLYPNHKIFSDKILLTIYPFETALAIFITMMMKELAGEEKNGYCKI